ncbi:MAG: DNA polymerase III subunit beta [Candidatus Aegiribacteria sp.]|nr:DNA polymerase III subunit beta [Candidatus Aegiribacteria sp.]
MIKLLVNHSDLLKGLNCVATALPTRSSLPYLTNVLLETEGETLRLSATDLDTTVVTTISASITTSGSITLPGKKLHEIVRELSEEDIRLSGTGNRITISCGNGSFTLSGSSSEQFPSLPSKSGIEPASVPVEVLSDAIRKTSYAVARDDYRATLNGALLDIGENGFEMVATDGHRLSCITLGSISTPVAIHALVTQKALNLFAKLSSEGDVLIRFKGSQISFEFGNTVIFSRTIDGEYPPYKKIIPHDNDCILSTDREDLISVLRRVKTMANPTTHQIKFSLEKDKVLVHSESADTGDAQEDLTAEYKGNPFQIGFNGNFLMEILRNMGCERIVMKMKDSNTAVVITDEKETDDSDSYLALIMPVKLSKATEE